MEGETQSSMSAEMRFGERVLPTLDNNIKSGNSLIDLDFYDGQLDFEPGAEKKIKPFSWQQAFPQVFSPVIANAVKQSVDIGFDIIIGNPPYIKLQELQESHKNSIEYFKTKFLSAKAGNFDIYVLFDEIGLKLLNGKGLLGFIQPHKFFQADFGEGIRNIISKQKALLKVVNFGVNQVFINATTYTCLLFLSKFQNERVEISIVETIENWITESTNAKTFSVQQPTINAKWNFSNEHQRKLLNKLTNGNTSLQNITRKIFVGLQTSADKIYILRIIKWNNSTITCNATILNETTEIEIEAGFIKRFLLGKDIKKFEEPKEKNVVIFPYLILSGKAELMSPKYIKDNFPLGWKYLIANKHLLSNRENGKMNHDHFYAYIYPKNLSKFDSKKIMTPDIANHPKFTIDNVGNLYHTTTIYSFAFKAEIEENILFFLGVFNTPKMWFFLKNTGNVLRGGFFRFKSEYLKPFPIKRIDFTNASEKAKHDTIVDLVNTILNLHQQKQQTTLPEKLEQLQQRIHYTDDKINKLVYALYGLNEEEIKIVEGL